MEFSSKLGFVMTKQKQTKNKKIKQIKFNESFRLVIN